ncbi:MAG: hydroxymethylbilane synthase [Dehalococcoidia bacterium]|nr:hydroxymethylbilane synthase [Dehalococcoidia bacterium]
MNNKIVIGSRGSRLAMIQAESVAREIKQVCPGIEIEIVKIVTEGDRNRSLSIDPTGDIGIFVKALEEALLNRSIDIAVHSLKDLPTILPQQLCLAAVTERLDPRDAMVACSPLADLYPGSKIGTGSLRRAAQLKHLRPDLVVCGIRGNVDSRLRRVSSGQLQGVIVAAAALLRLGLSGKITGYLPLESFLPAAGQGALAIEAREGDGRVEEIIGPINHLPTWRAITAERAFVHTVEGGCRAPIAALATEHGDIMQIQAMVSDREGDVIMRDTYQGPANLPQEAGEKLARRMLKAGAAGLIKDARCR